MTRCSELLLTGSRAEQADVVAHFLELEGWPTYAEIVRGLARDSAEIIYRGWEIDRYRKPDGCFYGYAPSYDGLTPSDTQSAPALHELCEQIDEVIVDRSERAA